MPGSKKINLLLLFFYISAFTLFTFNFFDSEENIKTTHSKEQNKIVPQVNEFGLIVDSLIVKENIIKKNQTLSSILTEFDLSINIIQKIISKSKEVFDIRKIVSGKPYHSFYTSENNLKYLVYEQDPVNYIVIDLEDSVEVYKGTKKISVKRKIASGIINSSLYASLIENNLHPELVQKLSNIFAWQVDFYRIQKGDEFKIIYDEEYVDNESIGIGKVYGAKFIHNNKSFYAINFIQDNIPQFFDENGNSLRKAFLQAPLEFSRISSRYSKRRFHPVQKRFKPHLGTDYAAPAGTPIRTVGDGIVVEASYSRGNGNYVKIKHNSVYSTQYLHMSGFAKGIRKGVRVNQGDIIGYVGSTGLATGPHLCYRFWKNGVQVDPFKEDIPPSFPVKNEYEKEFNNIKELIVKELNDQLLDEKISTKTASIVSD